MLTRYRDGARNCYWISENADMLVQGACLNADALQRRRSKLLLDFRKRGYVGTRCLIKFRPTRSWVNPKRFIGRKQCHGEGTLKNATAIEEAFKLLGRVQGNHQPLSSDEYYPDKGEMK